MVQRKSTKRKNPQKEDIFYEYIKAHGF